jgi:deoxyribose-phosphate aldolase
MSPPVADLVYLERVIELVTREVLLAVSEDRARAGGQVTCRNACIDGLCIETCTDAVGRVVSAGASRVSAGLGAVPPTPAIAKLIDHTLLKPDATPDQIAQLCAEARQHGFASVCVNPAHVAQAASLLRGSDVKVCTVIGFPLGATLPEVKVFEALDAIHKGANEIDMVINIGALKARDYTLVARDIQGVVQACHERGALTKVIIEAALLTDEEKTAACLLAKEAGADYVKTSTGFGPGGATAEDVELMRRAVGPGMGVKAAGGIRTLEEAERMVRAGATRIGASAGVRIVQEAQGSPAPAPASGSKAY